MWPLQDEQLITAIYGDADRIAKMDDDGVVELGKQLKSGRADRDAGVRWCPRAGHRRDAGKGRSRPSGQVTLYDGRTGDRSTAR
jgi:hypothetical protein